MCMMMGADSVNRVVDNKVWRYRLELVRGLHKWVEENLDPHAEVYGRTNKKATPEGQRVKAVQYVSDHLALGKMLYPDETTDPLFTESMYENESMRHQLKRGAYESLQWKVLKQIELMAAFDWTSVPEVTLAEVEGPLADTAGLRRARESLVSTEDADNKMVGLILRYQCLGAFESNFHASVPAEWGRALPDFVECFASPFNHKFKKYHSMFEEDREFGSSGNFFSMVNAHRGILPPGKYEMNPPWMNAVFERLQRVIKDSLHVGKIQVVLIGPKWKTTRWIPGLDGVMDGIQGLYWLHSMRVEKVVLSVQDLTSNQFQFKTIAWVFSNVQISEGVLGLLK